MSLNLFVYGSLISSKVINLVIGRVPSSIPGTLIGFHRYQIKDKVYPAISQLQESSVDGLVYTNLTENEIELLDKFEGSEYIRKEVLIDTADIKVNAFVYVWSSEDLSQLYGSWSYTNHFIPNESLFINAYEGFDL